MGADNHPTAEVETDNDLSEEAEEWVVDIMLPNQVIKSDFTVSGPKRIQALQQAWKNLDDRLQELGLADAEFGEIGLTVRKPEDL